MDRTHALAMRQRPLKTDLLGIKLVKDYNIIQRTNNVYFLTTFKIESYHSAAKPSALLLYVITTNLSIFLFWNNTIFHFIAIFQRKCKKITLQFPC